MIARTYGLRVPDSWVAEGMHLTPAELYKVSEQDREDPRIEFRLSA